MPSVAIEGLPGTGKTSAIRRCLRDVAGLMIDELVPPPPDPSEVSFFVKNDLAKERRLRESGNEVVLLDRYWPSTATYEWAKRTMEGSDPPGVSSFEHVLYGRGLFAPSAYVYLDDSCWDRSI